MSDLPARPKLTIVKAIDEAEDVTADAGDQGAAGGGTETPGREAGPDEPRGGPGDGDPADGLIARALLPRTDLGNAQRFVKRFGFDFLFVPEWGWLAWDGKRWNAREAEAILGRAVQQTIYGIKAEAEALKDSNFDMVVEVKSGGREIWLSEKLHAWCAASQSNAHVSCVARLAQVYLTASSDQFDRDPMAFNVLNGTLRFARNDDGDDYVSFHPHDRADRMTKMAAVAYDASAAAPVYDAFLARVQPEEGMRRHLHAWGGLSLTGLQVARLAFWYGTGRNGKSTLIDAWAYLAGDYSQTIPIESFLDQGRARRGGEASPDIAALPGVRCLRTSEPEKSAKLAESLVKLVTGGEPLRARHLSRDFFEFRPCFKLTMQGNYKPRIDGTDEGMWSRMLLVPWLVMIPAEERDTALGDKLKAEGSGILNRLLDGLRDYLDAGLSPPELVLSATQEYREDSDPIGRFLHECTERLPPVPAADRESEVRVAGADLYRVFKAWCAANGERVWSPKGFSRGLQDHGIARIKSSGIWYRNLRLIKSVHDYRDQAFEDHDKAT